MQCDMIPSNYENVICNTCTCFTVRTWGKIYSSSSLNFFEIYMINCVDAIFGPVTWRHQGHPFVCVLACKRRKTRRGLAGGASSDDQVS